MIPVWHVEYMSDFEVHLDACSIYSAMIFQSALALLDNDVITAWTDRVQQQLSEANLARVVATMAPFVASGATANPIVFTNLRMHSISPS